VTPAWCQRLKRFKKMAPLRRLTQELLGSGVCRDARSSKWSRGSRLIRPEDLGGNHLRPLIPIVSVSGYAVIRPVSVDRGLDPIPKQ
jgi:hypothetical protein